MSDNEDSNFIDMKNQIPSDQTNNNNPNSKDDSKIEEINKSNDKQSAFSDNKNEEEQNSKEAIKSIESKPFYKK